MIKRSIVFLGLFAPCIAMAQSIILPPAVSGQGTMSVGTTSTAVSSANITLAPNSGGFPGKNLPAGYIRVKLQSTATANITVCWLGGTCTATNGEVLAPGESTTKGLQFLNLSGQTPTIIAASGTQPVEVEW